MKYILPDGSITNIQEQASFEFIKSIIDMEDEQIEFAPFLGIKREFYNVQDLINYISKKFLVPISSFSVESAGNNQLNLKLYGRVIGKLSINLKN